MVGIPTQICSEAIRLFPFAILGYRFAVLRGIPIQVSWTFLPLEARMSKSKVLFIFCIVVLFAVIGGFLESEFLPELCRAAS